MVGIGPSFCPDYIHSARSSSCPLFVCCLMKQSCFIGFLVDEIRVYMCCSFARAILGCYCWSRCGGGHYLMGVGLGLRTVVVSAALGRKNSACGAFFLVSAIPM
ncbi:hypothetical protein Nepgr_023931 [Nepenthes gracilis]|uniref:Uncharacterized protein n=1 Tax=Nepenthes gracilis TaxID=150966 RepID=A0AAD3T331_NEPGR|nr:hypothetical protein Nepgr_023931 [Nepenthes gracilis]